jgi:hypothetical protein
MSDPLELLDAYAGSTVYLEGHGEYSADRLTPAAFAALRAVLAYHDESRHEPVCVNCYDEFGNYRLWPCPTVKRILKALEGA